MKSFFISLFAIMGAFVGLAIVVLGLVLLASSSEKESFPSKVKILPDAEGSRKELSSDTPLILQITIDGEIGKGKVTAKEIEEMLLDSHEDAFKSNRVKALLLVINSPGGSVTDTDTIYHLIQAYKKRYQIPVYAYVDGICASGGYYIACASDKIYTSTSSLVGSIGVIGWPPFMNVYEVMEKIGVNSLTISAGQGKDEMNPFRRWKENEPENYQKLIGFFYGEFVGIVSKNRPISEELLKDKIGARVYPAPEAESLGLIDGHNMSRSDAILALAKTAKIEKKYQVVGFETSTWLKKLFQEKSSSPLLTGIIKHELKAPTAQENPFSYIFVR